MTDHRETPANEYVAHVSLQERVNAPRFTEGTWKEVTQPFAKLSATPNGPRERELLLGGQFLELEERDGFSFGYTGCCGYVGYIATSALRKSVQIPSHRVKAIRTYTKDVPELKDTGPAISLAFSSAVNVTGTHGDWSEITVNNQTVFVPSAHLCSTFDAFDDPVAIAQMFLGTPYLWGGNSSFGIDCSGLVQAAFLACGIPCPGDADQQQAVLGAELPQGETLQRSDLLFWKGHVALCVDAERMIHANATHMAVVCENTEQAISRILAKGGGPVVARKRM